MRAAGPVGAMSPSRHISCTEAAAWPGSLQGRGPAPSPLLPWTENDSQDVKPESVPFYLTFLTDPPWQESPQPPRNKGRVALHHRGSGCCGMSARSHLYTSFLPLAGLGSGCQVSFLPRSLCPAGVVRGPATGGSDDSLTRLRTMWMELRGKMQEGDARVTWTLPTPILGEVFRFLAGVCSDLRTEGCPVKPRKAPCSCADEGARTAAQTRYFSTLSRTAVSYSREDT